MKKSSRVASQRAPKKLTAIQTSRHFRVSHHRHSGKLLPRQHTSYPTLLMLVLCVGVLLASWTRFVEADTFVYPGPKQDTYDVNASVPGPPPTTAASIDSPLDGDIFTDIPITVSGTCPINTYVSLSRNNVFSGVAICKADGTYSIKTGLFGGINRLSSQVYSQTDIPGPASNVAQVTYNPPVAPVAVAPSKPALPTDSSSKKPVSSSKKPVASTNASASLPLLLKSNFKYQGVYTGTATDWQLSVEGGTAPYAINVDWGDGTNSVVSRPKSGIFNLQHRYKKAGEYKGSYTATFTASDADGTTTYLQLITVVNDQPLAGAGTGSNDMLNPDPSPSYLENIVKYFWPGYGIVMLMLISFWLGERRELHYLQPQLKKIRHSH